MMTTEANEIALRVADELAPEFGQSLHANTEHALNGDLPPPRPPTRSVLHDSAAVLEIARFIVEVTPLVIFAWREFGGSTEKVRTAVFDGIKHPIHLSKQVAQRVVDAVLANVEKTSKG
jgi:hypothetical protein